MTEQTNIYEEKLRIAEKKTEQFWRKLYFALKQAHFMSSVPPSFFIPLHDRAEWAYMAWRDAWNIAPNECLNYCNFKSRIMESARQLFIWLEKAQSVQPAPESEKHAPKSSLEEFHRIAAKAHALADELTDAVEKAREEKDAHPPRRGVKEPCFYVLGLDYEHCPTCSNKGCPYLYGTQWSTCHSGGINSNLASYYAWQAEEFALPEFSPDDAIVIEKVCPNNNLQLVTLSIRVLPGFLSDSFKAHNGWEIRGYLFYDVCSAGKLIKVAPETEGQRADIGAFSESFPFIRDAILEFNAAKRKEAREKALAEKYPVPVFAPSDPIRITSAQKEEERLISFEMSCSELPTTQHWHASNGWTIDSRDHLLTVCTEDRSVKVRLGNRVVECFSTSWPFVTAAIVEYNAYVREQRSKAAVEADKVAYWKTQLAYFKERNLNLSSLLHEKADNLRAISYERKQVRKELRHAELELAALEKEGKP